MSKFKYEIFQRVMVPGHVEPVQGVIASCSASLNGEPTYEVVSLQIRNVEGKESILPGTATFKQSAIDAAQPAPTITQFDADVRVSAARAEERAKLGRDISDLNGKIDRLERNAKRRQKSKAKSSRKRG